MGTIEDLTPEAEEEIKDQIKKIEDGILEKIKKYNEDVKLAEIEENNLRALQNRAYIVSEQFRKASRTSAKSNSQILDKLEAELNELDTKIQGGLNETLSAKTTALVSLQGLYTEHVDYLAKVANGLKQRCDKLQTNFPVVSNSTERSQQRPNNLIAN